MCLWPDQLTGCISSLLWLVRHVHAIQFLRHFTDVRPVTQVQSNSTAGSVLGVPTPAADYFVISCLCT